MGVFLIESGRVLENFARNVATETPSRRLDWLSIEYHAPTQIFTAFEMTVQYIIMYLGGPPCAIRIPEVQLQNTN